MAEVSGDRLITCVADVATHVSPMSRLKTRALFYPLERPTTNLSAKVYRIGDVLAEWRAAERELAEVDPATEEGAALAAEVALLRSQYQEMVKYAAAREKQLGGSLGASGA